MNTISRDFCVLTGEKDLEHLYTFQNFPIYMGCTDEPAERDTFADMNWDISRRTGCIQLNPLLPLETVYALPHQSGQIGSLWMEHHQAFAAFVGKFSPSSVLEIGGAHGMLSTLFHREQQKIPWCILEPNPQPVSGCPARYIRGFFDANFHTEERYDAIVHSHFLEHIYYPDSMIELMSRNLIERSYMIFSLPHLQTMLKRKYSNCLNFEHTVYLTEEFIEYLLAKHSLNIICKEYFKDDHSIFYAAQKKPSCPVLHDEYEENKKDFMTYITYHLDMVETLNKRLASLSIPAYLFGAHVFSQFLFAFGLNQSRFVRILDNDPLKQGKRLYGTRLMVDSPKCLKDVREAVVVLKAGVYNTEIKQDIINNINKNILFL